MLTSPLARQAAWASVVALALAVMVTGSPAHGATFMVDATQDQRDADLGDDLCNNGTNDCTLRAAVQQANATEGPDVILVEPGLYVLNEGRGEDAARSGDLDVSGDVLIANQDCYPETRACSLETQANVVISANGKGRVFEVLDGTLELRGVTITSGDASAEPTCSGNGGAICSFAAAGLVVRDSILQNNTAVSGGAVFGRGEFHRVIVRDNQASARGGGLGVSHSAAAALARSRISQCSLTGNKATGGGGAIAVGDGAELVIERTAIGAGNEAGSETRESDGGGLLVRDDATIVTVENSTFSGNKATGGGGGVHFGGGTLALHHATIAGNTAGESGGGLASASSGHPPTLVNTLLAENLVGTSTASDCAGPVRSEGNNLVAVTTGCAPTCNEGVEQAWCPGDELSQAAGLGELTSAGVRPLLDESPALDAGNQEQCAQTDQRGVARDADRTCKACDIGAFELDLPDVDGDGVVDCGDDAIKDNCPGVSNRPKSTPADSTCTFANRTRDCLEREDGLGRDLVCKIPRRCVLAECADGDPCERCADDSPCNANGKCADGDTCEQAGSGAACTSDAECTADGEACREAPSGMCDYEPCTENADCDQNGEGDGGTGLCFLRERICRYAQEDADEDGVGDACDDENLDADALLDGQEPAHCRATNDSLADAKLGFTDRGCSATEACSCDMQRDTCACPGQNVETGAERRWRSPRQQWRCLQLTAKNMNEDVCTDVCADYVNQCVGDCGTRCDACAECSARCHLCPDPARCPTAKMSKRDLKRLLRDARGEQTAENGDERCGARVRCTRAQFRDPRQDCDVDGVLNGVDNCKRAYNPGQADSDSDGRGDVCDSDDDGDGVPDDEDNCKKVANPGQQDGDDDNVGTACDMCPGTSSGSSAHGRPFGCAPEQNCTGICAAYRNRCFDCGDACPRACDACPSSCYVCPGDRCPAPRPVE